MGGMMSYKSGKNDKVMAILPAAGMFLLFAYAGLSVNALMGEVRMTAFSGGKFEASGVTHVAGTNGIIFVDDGRPNEVFWMQVDENGRQSGAIKAVPLGTSVDDLEGITNDGTHFYAVGSQSRPKSSDQTGLVRFKFDASAQKISGAETISGLKSFLAANIAELRGMGNRTYKDGGLNIEGLAWDPQGNRLLLGLRSPVVDSQALIVPLRLRDANGPFTSDNLVAADDKAIRLPLGGAGIRAIEYDDQTKRFLIISGAANGGNIGFKLWEWDGQGGEQGLRATPTTFDRQLKPEGIARVTSGSRNFNFVVFDASGYSILQ